MAVDQLVKIKGSKNGLVFLLDDSCTFEQLLEELRLKLEKTHQQILSGPRIQVQIRLGAREIDDPQKNELLELLKTRENLEIVSIESELPPALPPFHVIKGIIRSGQTRHYEGNVLFIGDVNPGGTITCTGDIYVLGSLKGVAHAGIEGNEEAVVAASHLKPTQLRIAGVISRPPDEWGVEETLMEFAYLNDQTMNIEKINSLHRIRPELSERKGE